MKDAGHGLRVVIPAQAVSSSRLDERRSHIKAANALAGSRATRNYEFLRRETVTTLR
jgi:hypothetical protein